MHRQRMALMAPRRPARVRAREEYTQKALLLQASDDEGRVLHTAVLLPLLRVVEPA